MPEGRRSAAEDSAGPTLVPLDEAVWRWWIGCSGDWCSGIHLRTDELLYGYDDDDQGADDEAVRAARRLLLASRRLWAVAQ